MRHACTRAGSCLVAVVLTVSPAALRGQPAEPTVQGQAQPSPSDPGLVRKPPELLELPPLNLPVGMEVSKDSLQVTIAIDVEGRAVLEATVAEGELRALMDDVVARAVFVPATVDGVPVPARVSLRFAVEAAPAQEVPSSPPREAPGPPAASTAQLADARTAEIELMEAPAYGAVAEVERPQPTARKLQLEEMREVPGAFGDPFRVLDTLPGVVPIFSGLPYVYVRGAPPAGTGYFYDGIAVPALFHLALGPAVIHPRMIGDLDFYPAVAPARYGRHIGGLFAAQGKHGGGAGMGAQDDAIHGEVEWRLIDLQAMVDVPSDDTRLTLAGRYGYPGLLLTLLQEDAILDYWDYQLRLSQRLSARDRVVMTVFGSYDVAGDKHRPDDRLVLQFHRAESRLIRQLRSTELGVALQGGYERSQLGDSFRVTATRIGPRAWVTSVLSDRVRMHAGVDMLATVGEITERLDSGDDEPGQRDGSSGVFGGEEEVTQPGPMGTPGQGVGDPGAFEPGMGEPRAFDESAEDGKDSPFASTFASVAGRNLLGAHVQFEVDLTERWLVQPGLRADAWLTGSSGEGSVDPRLMTSYRLSDPWTVYLAAGTGHQPTTPPIPLPGFSDVALERQLQRAIKTEGGVAWDPGSELTVEAELYYSYMDDVMLFDLTFDCEGLPEGPLRDECETPLPRGEIEAYGVELFVKRDAKHRLSGWISYTLGQALGAARELSFTPAADVRHVGNVVAQWRLGGGFYLGTRLHARTGKVFRQDRPQLFIRDGARPAIEIVEARLPGFFRADAQGSYRWKTAWGEMRLTLEWMNFTLEREPIGLRCDDADLVDGQLNQAPCRVEYGPLITIPNIGVRGSF